MVSTAHGGLSPVESFSKYLLCTLHVSDMAGFWHQEHSHEGGPWSHDAHAAV